MKRHWIGPMAQGTDKEHGPIISYGILDVFIRSEDLDRLKMMITHAPINQFHQFNQSNLKPEIKYPTRTPRALFFFSDSPSQILD